MTVAELIQVLQGLAPNMEVCVRGPDDPSAYYAYEAAARTSSYDETVCVIDAGGHSAAGL